MTSAPRILVLGLGNDVAGDDAVGLVAARRLRVLLPHDIRVEESSEAGLALLDLISGHTHLLVLDAVVLEHVPEGSVLEYDLSDLRPVQTLAPHYAGLPDLALVASRYGIAFPETVRALAVAIRQPAELREGLSPPVRAAVDEIVRQALSILKDWQADSPPETVTSSGVTSYP